MIDDRLVLCCVVRLLGWGGWVVCLFYDYLFTDSDNVRNVMLFFYLTKANERTHGGCADGRARSSGCAAVVRAEWGLGEV